MRVTKTSTLLRSALVALTLCAVTASYGMRCPGKLCDIDEVLNCSEYVEVQDDTPLTPTLASVDPHYNLNPGVTRDCGHGSGSITLSTTHSEQETLDVTSTGANSTSLGLELKGDIAGLVSPGISTEGTNSSSNSWGYSGSGTTSWTYSCSQSYGDCQSAHIKAYTTRKYGSFMLATGLVAQWTGSSGCYYVPCNRTTANGSANHFYSSVAYDAGTGACPDGCGGTQTG